MTTAELLAEVHARGLQIALNDSGRPVIRGDAQEATPALLRVLAIHREAIATMLRPRPRRQWLWRDGHVYTEHDGAAPDWHPVGAWWVRMEGEEEWAVIERRSSDAMGATAPVPLRLFDPRPDEGSGMVGTLPLSHGPDA